MNSMTGYGRNQEIINGRDVSVEIKSVNHRFFEFSARIPRIYGYLDEKLKTFVQAQVSRGKIDVGVTVFTVEGKEVEVEINKALVGEYVMALRSVRDDYHLKDDLSLSSVMRFSDIFSVKKTVDDEEIIWESVSKVAQVALEKFILMRETEGRRLKADIAQRLAAISDYVKIVEEKAPQTVAAYKERITAKMMEVLEDKNIDEQRIITEAAIFSERIAVDEETVRLKSHIKQFLALIEEDEPVGRKLDFMVQELNREVNTIGSKCQNIEVTGIVVEMKSEIEKIREQIQNIE